MVTARKSGSASQVEPTDVQGHEPFGDGQLWVGQHAGDGDILVFDPSAADPSADILTLYSLAQHRTRSFPRGTVVERVQPVGDEIAYARAKKDYAERATLRATHEEGLATARAERSDKQRNAIIGKHRRYVEALELAYEGVQAPAADARRGRVQKCHACGIVLDDFVGALCGICSGALCSCGACACGKPARRS